MQQVQREDLLLRLEKTISNEVDYGETEKLQWNIAQSKNGKENNAIDGLVEKPRKLRNITSLETTRSKQTIDYPPNKW